MATYEKPANEKNIWRMKAGLWLQAFRQNWSLFAENKIGIIGLVVIVIFAVMALVHPLLIRTVWDKEVYDPIIGYAYDMTVQPAPPSAKHLLGTDPLGRDILSQLMWSARSEFILGLTAAIVTVVIATIVGALSAYFGRFVDVIFMRFADLIIMMPTVSLLIVLGVLFEMDIFKLAIILGIIAGFGATAVVIKAQALSIKVKAYNEAAKVAGGGHFHIIRVHMIPNLLPISFLYMMFTVTASIFSEAVLSFFGILNIRMSWGIMIHTAQNAGYLSSTQYWWLLMPAGVSITLLCASFYLVGRALDEVVNPRLRRR